jgi:hypothetical protein
MVSYVTFCGLTECVYGKKKVRKKITAESTGSSRMTSLAAPPQLADGLETASMHLISWTEHFVVSL